MPFYTEPDPKKLTRSIESVRNTFSKVSTTTFFKVTFPINGGLKTWLSNVGIFDSAETDGLDGLEKIELLCSEASLPGPSFKKTEVVGNRQGVRESYPILRAFPELQLTFYVDKNHAVIRFFEEWFNYINPLYYGNKQIASTRRGQNDRNAFDNEANYKFRYPNEYCQHILITKFEKDLEAVSSASIANSTYYTYEFIQAYPASILAAPVSYQGSQVLKYTVVFDYMRYITRRTPEGFIADNLGFSANSIGIVDLKSKNSTTFTNPQFAVDTQGVFSNVLSDTTTLLAR